MRYLLLALLLTACSPGKRAPPSSILLIGDSVTHGYAAKLVPMLAGKVKISTPADNCRNSWYTSQHIREWATGYDLIYSPVPKADVVIWNNGIWNSMQPVAPIYGRTDAEYIQELQNTLNVLQSLGYDVVFATTTDIPTGAAASGFIPGREVQLNALARSALPIDIIDLYGVARDKHLNENDVHFTDSGYQELAATVARFLGL